MHSSNACLCLRPARERERALPFHFHVRRRSTCCHFGRRVDLCNFIVELLILPRSPLCSHAQIISIPPLLRHHSTRMCDFEDEDSPDWIGCKPDSWETPASVANSMGKLYKRAYKMEWGEVVRLSRKLGPLIDIAIRKSGNKEEPTSPYTPIGHTLRLVVTLRLAKGGDPLDMMLMYGLSEPSVKRSVKHVMEAINNEEEWEAMYPDSQDERKEIARKFEKVRALGIRLVIVLDIHPVLVLLHGTS
jgi:hypothetical protein